MGWGVSSSGQDRTGGGTEGENKEENEQTAQGIEGPVWLST